MNTHTALSRLREIEALLTEKKLTLTKKRRVILELLLKNQHPMSAYHLLDVLQQQEPKAKPPTVYRALDFLIQHEIVHKIESNNHYMVCVHPHSTHHLSVLLICQQCRQVIEAHAEEIASYLQTVMLRHHFRGQPKTLEIAGLCDQCRIPEQTQNRLISSN